MDTTYGVKAVIFITIVILMFYQLFLNNTSNIPFSNLLPFQSINQTNKENLKASVQNVSIWNPLDGSFFSPKPQRKSETSKPESSTSYGQNNLPDRTHVFNGNKDMTTTELAQELKRKIEAASKEILMPANVTETCGPEEIKAFGCGGKTICYYRKKLPESYEDRIDQLVLNERLQIQPDHLKAIQSMSDQFKKRPKLLIITGASSNHYLESQAMIRLVHQNVPHDLNYEFIVYDLGLETEERNMMEKFCNCTMIKFPFSAFPEHVKDLHCYGWKPTIIYAHIQHADVVMWADASIRIRNETKGFRRILQRTKERGLAQQRGGRNIPQHTVVQMFHYFGDEPCVYKPYMMMQSGAGFYHNEPLVRQAILAPWVACALAKKCMCPLPPTVVRKCAGIGLRWERPYANCHRFDQSALNIILSKLYQRAVKHTTIFDRGVYDIKRGDHVPYFNYLNRTVLQKRHISSWAPKTEGFDSK